MIGNLRPATDAEIERLLANPEHVTRFLYGGESTSAHRAVLGRAWHAIHFVLTGSRLGGEAPLNFLADEGTPVGDVDVGFGPARVLTSRQVRRLAEALVPLDIPAFARKVDVQALDDAAIYPGEWSHNGSGESLSTSYQALRDLVLRSAEAGLGLVLYIN
jgi:hypothetical protein